MLLPRTCYGGGARADSRDLHAPIRRKTGAAHRPDSVGEPCQRHRHFLVFIGVFLNHSCLSRSISIESRGLLVVTSPFVACDRLEAHGPRCGARVRAAGPQGGPRCIHRARVPARSIAWLAIVSPALDGVAVGT
jgi:hypothetical protein